MIVGLTIGYIAAKTLGRFYTRTLQIVDSHQVVRQGLYRIIRHPGYLGVLLIDIGAGCSVNNWAALSVIAIAAFLSNKLYRISVEEAMLKQAFGEQYSVYAEQTWRLIPFVY